MFYDDSEHYIEVFKLFLLTVLNHPEIFKDQELEFDASLTFDYEASVTAEYISSLGLPPEDTFEFYGYIYAYEEEDASPVAEPLFFSTGSIAKQLRGRFQDDFSDEDDCEEEDEYDDEVFINVRLRGLLGKLVNEEKGSDYTELIYNFEILHIYNNDEDL